MRSRRVGAVAAAATLLGLAGCGAVGQRTPDLSKLPLVPGARFEVQQRVCDSGAKAYCAWELVVSDTRYRNSDALFEAEHKKLLKSGWSGADGDIGNEHGADSPGHKLRLTYAPPVGDLQGIDFGWIRRTREIALALSKATFDHIPVISMMLEVGAS
jgi:hypothetical protein